MHCKASAPDDSHCSSTLPGLLDDAAGCTRQHVYVVIFCHFCWLPASVLWLCIRRLEAPGGVVGSYLHASPAPGVGRMGALVGLQVLHQRVCDGGSRVQYIVVQVASQSRLHMGETVWYTVPLCAWSLAQTGSGADLAAADAKAAAQELAGKLAMHVVAMRPPYLSRETGGRQAHKHDRSLTG